MIAVVLGCIVAMAVACKDGDYKMCDCNRCRCSGGIWFPVTKMICMGKKAEAKKSRERSEVLPLRRSGLDKGVWTKVSGRHGVFVATGHARSVFAAERSQRIE